MSTWASEASQRRTFPGPPSNIRRTSFCGWPAAQSAAAACIQAESLRVPYDDGDRLKLSGRPGDGLEDDFLMLADVFPTAFYANELARTTTGDVPQVCEDFGRRDGMVKTAVRSI